jgi:hypothetical protein
LKPAGASAAFVWGLFAVLLALAAVPVLSTALPPLFDYPNHLARMHLLTEGGDAFYEVRWAALPNLAEDLIVPPLARLMPLDLAGKLFVVMIFALLAGGTLWLNRLAAGAWRWWPLLAFLLLYNRTFLWGFLNYLFGVGVALCGTALWLALEDRRARLRVVVSSAVSLACFFSHLAAWGVYALLILGVELVPALRELRGKRWTAVARRLVAAAPQFVLPAAIFLGLSPQPAVAQVSYADYWRKADLLFGVFDNYDRTFDIACFAGFVVLIAILAKRRRLGLDPRLGCALGLIFAAYLALPSRMLFASGVDHRLPPAGFLLLVAASAPRFWSRRAAFAIGTAAGLVLVLRMAVIETVWREADRVYAADLAGIDALPRGARLALAFPGEALHVTRVPELHLATLAIARREAFVPTLFAYPAQQPIVLKPEYAALASAAPAQTLWSAFHGGGPAEQREGLRALSEYDYVVFTGPGPLSQPETDCFDPVFRRTTFQIFAVSRAPACASLDR